MNAQVARHLKIEVSKIKSVEEWANVLFVRFVSGSPRFVSKKVLVVAAVIKTASWSLPTGEALEMRLCDQGHYQVYVNGVFRKRQDAKGVTVEAFAATPGAVLTFA